MIEVDYIAKALHSLDNYVVRENGQIIPWYTKVDLEQLDFGSVTKSVLGQVFGEYIEGKKQLGNFLGTGFSFTWTGEAWTELTADDKDRWIREIQKRQECT